MLTDTQPIPDGIPEDLRRQLEFVIEVDGMKSVLRQTAIASGERRENDAEHSWHLALMALVLSGHADEPVDVARVVTMLLVHDLVEVYAGDTPLHLKDEGQEQREREAADRLFPILPEPQAGELRAAWEEFEAHATPEARFARSLDRLQPLLLEWIGGGPDWKRRERKAHESRATMEIIADGSASLWQAAQAIIEDAARRGLLR